MKKSFYDRLVDIVIALKWVYIILLILALGYIAWFIFFYSSCVPKNEMICYNDDYFIYRVEEIPEQINGIKVVKIGCTNRPQITAIAEKYGDEKYAQIKSENLKKIFLTSNVQIINARFTGKAIQSLKYEGTMFILNTSSWSGEKAYKSSYATTSISIRANVSYFYNYDNAPNDNYYWIDNYDYGKKIEFIPPKPTREGYIFDGWYKESECINKWDFEIDVLPEVKYTDVIPTHQLRNDETRDTDFRVYQETKLYAKWIEQGG